jgi:hypothetical protein
MESGVTRYDKNDSVPLTRELNGNSFMLPSLKHKPSQNLQNPVSMNIIIATSIGSAACPQ